MVRVMFGNNYITSVFILHTEGMGKIKTDSKIASYMVHVIWKICIRFFVFKRKFLKAATIVFIMFFIIMQTKYARTLYMRFLNLSM